MHGGGCRVEVVVLRGVSLASICWLLVFFFFFFWLIVGVGWWVLILIDLFFFFGSLVGFDDLATDWVGDDLA